MKNKLKLIKRWKDMLTGKSTFNVKQGVGRIYSATEIKGYYNDLTNKVSNNTVLDEDGIPVNTTIAGVKAYFPISIFQYGLGLYDLFLLENKEEYLDKFFKIANWAIENQENDGMWDCFAKLRDKAHKTQSSMCQSQGVSVLLRAYTQKNEKKYFDAAKKAIDFMIKDVKDGGTCLYQDDSVIFQEYVSEYNLSVLNGWIFSIFGLYDFCLIEKEEKYRKILEKTIETLSQKIKEYDRKYWSNYDLKKTIASPAYHNLHIMQLQLLYDIFKKKEFKEFIDKWTKYENSKINRFRAIIVKLKQKFFPKEYYDINTSLEK